MAQYTQVAEKAADRVISGLKQAQDFTVSAISSVTGIVGGILPDLPSLPFAGKLPAPEKLVKTYFTIAEDVLKTNKQYALNLVEALEPVTGKIVHAKKTTKKSTSPASA